MDQYVQIMSNHHRHPIVPAPNIRFTHPYPLNRSRNSLSKQQSKGQHRTLGQSKPALQNPYASFKLRGARSG
jgi:hypothetical protein